MPEREMRGPRRPRGDGGYLALPSSGGGGGGGQYGSGAVQQYSGGPGGQPARPPLPPGQHPGQFADPTLLASVGQADYRYGF